MKTSGPNLSARYRQSGSVVLVLLILLVIMAMLATANSSTLLHLHRELKLLDQRQVERLNASQTNATDRAGLPPVPAEARETK
jgi:Tfp pilus assembly protein PilX